MGDTATLKHYLDESGEPITPSPGMSLPEGYTLLSTTKSPSVPKKKVSSVKELKKQAEKLKPVTPPPGYILSNAPTLADAYPALAKGLPHGEVSAYEPSLFEQLKNTVANSAIGHAFESKYLQPTENIDSPDYQRHKEQLLSPEYLAPFVHDLAEDIRGYHGAGTVPNVVHDPAAKRTPNEERAEGVLRAAGGLTTAPNLLMAAAFGAAARPAMGGIELLSPVAKSTISRLVSGAFTLDMLHGLYQQHKEYRKAVDSGNLDEAYKIQGEMGVTGIMALLTGKHALTPHPFTPVTEIPTRERTNVLHRNTAGEVRQANGQAPTVWLSPSAWKSFMGELYPGENAGDTNGVNLPATEPLRHFATEHQPATPNPTFAEVQQLLAKAHESADAGGVAVAKKRGSIQKNVNVMREELNHTWQRGLANGNVNNHLDTKVFNDLYQHIPSGMYDHLIEEGYSGHNSPEIVTEAAAKLMDGRPERFGVTEDDAVDFLDRYFKEVTAKHGAKALEELHHVRGIAADAKARAIEEHGRTGAGQSNQPVPSVAAGGQGGAAQGVQPEGEGVNDPARAASQVLVSPVSGESPQAPAGTGSGGAGEAASIPNENQPLVETGAEGRRGSLATGDLAQSSLGLDPTFNREKDKPIWYLKSERLIGEKMRGPMPAEDVGKMLLSGGVKPEEMHWTGLDEFLKSKGKEKVTPQEIREHLAANNINIEEVVKGYDSEPLSSDEETELDKLSYKNLRSSLSPEERSRYENLTERRTWGSIKDKQPKYSSYVLPGAENYREMLLTMQPRVSPEKAALDAFREQLKKKYGFPIITDAARTRLTPEERAQEETLFNAVGDRDLSPTGNDFKSSHWDEPNILAHVRFNDRNGPEGKLLHVEELQSDWHSAARKRGYVDKAKEAQHQARVDELGKQMEDAYDGMKAALERNDGLGYDTISEAKSAIVQHPDWAERWDVKDKDDIEAIDKWANARRESLSLEKKGNEVPDAPWKKSWHEQTLRRMLHHAATQGYNGLSWTGGEDQADRYDLSKQVGGITYFKNKDADTYNIIVHGLGEESPEITRQNNLTPDKLADVIGKDMAQKIIDNEGGDEEDKWYSKSAYDFAGTLSGLDLKVGGQGMKGFYDKIVPDFLNKFGKRYGAKVGTTEIGTGGKSRTREDLHWTTPDKDYEQYQSLSIAGMDTPYGYVAPDGEGGYEVGQVGEDPLEFFDTIEEGKKWLEDHVLKNSVPSKTVQYLPITPEMRQSVAEEGVPLFNREQPSGEEEDNWIRAGAQDFAKKFGRDINLPRYLTPDFRGKDIADAFQEMKHDPADPKVKASYDALRKDIRQQWDYATQKMGVKFEPWKGEEGTQPYANSKEMTKDVKDNHHLWFFQGGDMAADHPLAEVDPETGLSYNDELRSVHDLFGHAMESFQFGPRGEENAWNAHAQMFSPEALPALTTETKGQNSWVNFGPQMRDAQGNILKPGQPGYLEPKDRKFAEQKAGLLPDRFHYRLDTPISFVSPNTFDLNMERAGIRLGSVTHRMFANLSNSLAESLNLRPVTNSAIGHWEGGAENSIVQHWPMGADPDAVRYHQAVMARLGNQNSWAGFFPDEKGADDLFVLTVKGSTPEKIANILKKNDILGSTIEPHPDGSHTVYIGGNGFDNANRATLAAKELGVTETERVGGKYESTGSSESREAAVAEHLRRIEEFERVHPEWRQSRQTFESRPDYGTLQRLIGETDNPFLEVRHGSPLPGLKEISPKKYGTGPQKGAEAARQKAWPQYWEPRSYFQIKGTEGTDEAMYTTLPHQYQALLNSENIYDITRDPDNLKGGIPAELTDPAGRFTALEKIVKEHGYDGLYTPGGVVEVFTKTKASPDGALFNREQEKTPEFQNWFSGSKVVDKDGEPKVLYHGTRSSKDFTEFSTTGPVADEEDEEQPLTSGSGADPTAFMGAHFAEEPEVENKFARGSGWMASRYEHGEMKPRILPAYLSVKNPKIFGAETNMRNFIYEGKLQGYAGDELLDSAMFREGIEEPEDDPRAEEWLQKYDNDPEFRVDANRYLFESIGYDPEGNSSKEGAEDLARQAQERLKAQGYDGVKYKNEVEGGTSWIAFEPEQVKSAIGNSGAFDPKDPNILRNREKIPDAEQDKKEAFTKLASAQRGKPESAMLKVTHDPLSYGVFAYLPEHVGDLTHRMSEGVEWGRSGYGYANVKDKVENALKRLDSPYGFEREMKENQRNNYDAMVEDGKETRSFLEAKKDFDRKTNAYADEHEKLVTHNRVQELAKKAAISVGRQDFASARKYLTELKTELDQGPEHWAKVAGEFNPDAVTQDQWESVALPPKAGNSEPDTRSGKLAAWVEEQGPQIVIDYIKKFSPNGVPYISPDAAKEMIPEYIENPTETNLDAGAAAGAITHAAWDSLLATKPIPGKESVIISTGSPASGKTSGILDRDQQASVGITRETIPHNIAALSKTIDQTIASGRNPLLILTYTESPSINMERAINRALKEGRAVPMDYMANAWLNQPKIVAEAMKKYGDQILVYTVDNSGAPGEHKVYADDASLALDTVSAYSPKTAMEAQNEVLERYKSTIPANIYNAFKESIIADSARVGGGDHEAISGKPDSSGESLSGRQVENPSAAGQTSLDANTPDAQIGEGGRGESPELVETGSAGTAPSTTIPVQGGTTILAAPVQIPAVPIAHRPVAKVLPLSQVKILAAGLNPNPQRQVHSVRELMKMAAQRMVP